MTSDKLDTWIDEVAKSPNTKRNYIHSINAYCGFLSKDHDQLITEARVEITAGLLLDERSIFYEVPRFKKYLRARNLPPNTIHGYIMAIQSFYTFYNILFPKQRDLDSTVLQGTNLQEAYLSTDVTYNKAVTEINNYRPFMSGTPTHARVCRGYKQSGSAQYLRICDPYPTSLGLPY